MLKRFESFTGSIVELSRMLQRLKDKEMRSYGLKGSHAMLLYYLGQHPEGLTSSGLTALCREDKAAVSRGLTQLIEEGYAVCNRTENKRAYRSLLFLTEKGRALAKELDETIEDAIFMGGSGLTDEERAVFYRAMEKIRGNLSAYFSAQQEED